MNAEDARTLKTLTPEGEDVLNTREAKFWSKPVVLVILSTVISGGFVSIGWKASMDTFAAVSTVKIQQHDMRIERLETQETDRIKASDLAIRDQLLDAKLSALQYEIQGLKEQLSNSRVEKR